MKSFQSFRLDTANHSLWHGQDRVQIPPKAYDVLRYLVENAGRVVTQDELLEAVWPETYVNPEILRKYILDVRKVLGDRSDKPVFIETVTKRGYRFIAPVIEESATEDATKSPELPVSDGSEQRLVAEKRTSKEQRASRKSVLLTMAIIAALLLVAGAAGAGHLWFARKKATRHSPNATSIAVL